MARVIVKPSLDDLVEADLPGVALRDRVGGDQAEVALWVSSEKARRKK